LFCGSKGHLDGHIAAMEDFFKMPNIKTTYFRNGITFISKAKSAKAKIATTGGAAGFRSCEFIMALIQVFLAVSLFNMFYVIFVRMMY
jgi:hypothetical protein